jgi:hypothetical protein
MATAGRVENGQDESRTAPFHFLHLTRPFSYSRSNVETGWEAVEGLSQPFLRDEPVFIP